MSQNEDNKPLLTKKQMNSLHRKNFKLELDDNIPLGLIIRFEHAKQAILTYKRTYKIYNKQSINKVRFNTVIKLYYFLDEF